MKRVYWALATAVLFSASASAAQEGVMVEDGFDGKLGERDSPPPKKTQTKSSPTDKTLVVWAAPANLTQRGGSALTLDDMKSHFDGIVFGELAPGKWMAGSDFWRRSRNRGSQWNPIGTQCPFSAAQKGKQRQA